MINIKILFSLIIINIFFINLYAQAPNIEKNVTHKLIINKDFNITRQENNSQNKTYFGDIIQGLSTIFAVLIGFLLSLYGTKSALKVQQLQQLREKQLSILLGTLKDLQTAIDLSNIILDKCYAYKDKNILQAKEVILSKTILKYIADIERSKHIILIRQSELRMLKLGEPASIYITDSLNILEKIISTLKNEPLKNIEPLQKYIDELKQIFQNILDTSVSSLNV